MRIPKHIAGCISIIIFLSVWFSSASAYLVTKTTGGADVKWFTPSATYLVNPTGGPANTLSAIQASMQTWTDVIPSVFTFVYGGTSSSTSCANYNGINLVCFGSMGLTGTLAQNSFWYYTVSGQIIESDVKFNTDYLWATDGSASAYDVQNVGTHEFGHSLSLADLYNTGDSEKTMYGYAATGETKKRSLDQDDINGISYLYPDTTPPVTTASPVGGSYGTGQTVGLTCNDGSGSGCSITRYCFGTGCTPTSPYRGPINITSSSVFRFSSTDNSGNSESAKTETYTITPDPPAGWTIETIESEGDVGLSSSIVLDSSDKIHIAYRNSSGRFLKYATNASGAWVITNVDGAIGFVVEHISLAIDSNGTLHISYSYGPYSSSDKYLRYATNASGDWVISTIESAGARVSYTSIAVDSNNKVHISYHDAADFDLRYATNVSGAWSISTVDSAGHVGIESSIAESCQ